jgi:hypothetical protein
MGKDLGAARFPGEGTLNEAILQGKAEAVDYPELLSGRVAFDDG